MVAEIHISGIHAVANDGANASESNIFWGARTNFFEKAATVDLDLLLLFASW